MPILSPDLKKFVTEKSLSYLTQSIHNTQLKGLNLDIRKCHICCLNSITARASVAKLSQDLDSFMNSFNDSFDGSVPAFFAVFPIVHFADQDAFKDGISKLLANMSIDSIENSSSNKDIKFAFDQYFVATNNLKYSIFGSYQFTDDITYKSPYTMIVFYPHPKYCESQYSTQHPKSILHTHI